MCSCSSHLTTNTTRIQAKKRRLIWLLTKNVKVAAKKVMTALCAIMTLTSMMLNFLTKKSNNLLSSHLCLFVFDEINEKRSQRQFFLCFRFKSKFKIFKYLHQFLKILKNTYCMVTLIPEMKSGPLKTYTLILNNGQLNNLVRRCMNWYCVYCHLGFNPLESSNRDKFEEKR